MLRSALLRTCLAHRSRRAPLLASSVSPSITASSSAMVSAASLRTVPAALCTGAPCRALPPLSHHLMHAWVYGRHYYCSSIMGGLEAAFL